MSEASRKAFLVKQLRALCLKKHGTTDAWSELFDSYDGNDDGALSRKECTKLFQDAQIGGPLVGYWVSGVFDHLDADEDDGLTRAELERAIANNPPPIKVSKVKAKPGEKVKYLDDEPKSFLSQIFAGVLVGVVTLSIMRRLS